MALLAHALAPDDAGPPRLTALLDLAFPCNLSCEGCERGERAGRPNAAAVEAVATRLSAAVAESPAGAVSLLVYGGEPLLDAEAVLSAGAIVRDACARRGLGYDAALITNATLLGDDLAWRLAEVGFGTIQVNVPAPPRPISRRGRSAAPERDPALLAHVARNAREAHAAADVVVRCEVTSTADLRDALDVVRVFEEEGILDPPRPATVVLGPRISYAAQARALFLATHPRPAAGQPMPMIR
jgi:MoaA/NifB/PqqE/SkfB family radical SAM enzyme